VSVKPINCQQASGSGGAGQSQGSRLTTCQSSLKGINKGRPVGSTHARVVTPTSNTSKHCAKGNSESNKNVYLFPTVNTPKLLEGEIKLSVPLHYNLC
jgi:hypothetical protein